MVTTRAFKQIILRLGPCAAAEVTPHEASPAEVPASAAGNTSEKAFKVSRPSHQLQL